MGRMDSLTVSREIFNAYVSICPLFIVNSFVQNSSSHETLGLIAWGIAPLKRCVEIPFSGSWFFAKFQHIETAFQLIQLCFSMNYINLFMLNILFELVVN